ncbi:MAG: hypothetical protein IJ328_06980 [Muribaculaceae bacterium]|nr:hypothetical protein [Muribaculaceae bacterium]
MATKKEKDNIIKQIKQGRIVSSDFFLKHWVTISLVLVISFVYISAKYTCQLRKEKIISLKNELNNAKTDCVRYSAEFKSQIREAKMKSLVDSMKLNLETAEQPPFKLAGK